LIDTADWTGSGTLTLTGETTRIDYLNTGDPAGAVINGNLDYIGSGANHFLLAAANSPNATEELTINAVIGNGNAGTGIWYTGGDGVIVLNGANTFNASSLQIRSATVVLGHNDSRDGTTAGALGKNTQIVSVGHTSGTSDAALLLKAGVTTDRLVRTVDDTGGAANTRTLGGYDTTGSATFAHTIELRNPTVGGGMTRLQALGISTITFAGVINQDGENTVGIEKIGSGTVVLSGNNSYKGETVVSAGTLVIDGIYTSPGLITVKGGATLGGIGIVGAINVESTGTLAPGNSIGELEGTSLTLDGGSILAWELHDNGADSDLLTLSGGLNQGSDTGWTFDFLGTGAVGTYTLIKFASTDFVTGDFGITGLKDGYSAPDGVVVNTSLSEVQLTVIPEPASLGALGMIALAALLRRRLRR
jgi:autotransporter-associated beta strand protein